MADSVVQARPAQSGGNSRLKGRPGRKPKGGARVVALETPDQPDPDHVLTWRQRKILRAIGESVRQRGYPPSMREIGDAVGLTSTSSVLYQLSTLQRKGYLHRQVGRARTMEVRLPGRPEGAAARHGPDEARPAELIPSQEAVHVPLIGRIVPDGPVVVGQYVQDVFPLPRQLVGDGTLFLLKVADDAMVNAAIAAGDWVAVRQHGDTRDGDMQNGDTRDGDTRDGDTRDGDIVAAVLDGGVTVRTLKHGDGHAWLIPHNPAYAPVPSDEASILGRVVAVLRRV